MTDDENDKLPEEQSDEIADALEETGAIEPEPEENDESEDSGGGSWLDKIADMTGTGESLENYENDPVAAVFAGNAEETPRGAKHIARGVDGLSPFAAAHPLVDIGVGFVLLQAEQNTGETSEGGTPGKDEELDSLGDMT